MPTHTHTHPERTLDLHTIHTPHTSFWRSTKSLGPRRHTPHVLLEFNEVTWGSICDVHVALSLWLHTYAQQDSQKKYFREQTTR